MSYFKRQICFAAMLLAINIQAYAQVGLTQPTIELQTANADQIVQQGQEFEKQGQWAEALTLYQKGLRKAPQDQKLLQRRAVARLHYDLDRRIVDSSFVDQVKRTDESIAEGIYLEILLKIQSSYVDDPNWHDIAQFGLTSLKIALESNEFRQQYIPNASLDSIKQAFTDLKEKLSKAAVQQRTDAQWVASLSANSLKQALGLPPQATYFEFVCGAISALDPYSAFLSDSQYTETMSQIEGNFVGLGVELKTLTKSLELVSVIPGGPADKGGLKAGDHITAVDNSVVETAGSEKCADLLRGEEGSYVRITYLRGQDSGRTLMLQRKRVEIPSVADVNIVDKANGVGYIRLTNFQKTTVKDFDAALWQLQRAGMRSLIVDLRGNPGGLLTASVEIADRFIGSGIIVATKGRNPLEDYTHRAELAGTWRMPLVVLVDENSASASEILAAAIRDHKRGTVVGTQSYGKGSVQGIFPLNISGGGVRLTTAKFYGPSGTSVNQVGVTPNIEVHIAAKPNLGDNEQAGETVDNALQAAIAVANQSNQVSTSR